MTDPKADTAAPSPSRSEDGQGDRQAEKTGVSAGEEYLVFVTIERKLAVPITGVREIRGWSQPTPLPHAPAYLLGVVNLRGTVLPVIDLAQRLGLGPTPVAPRNVFIVIEVGDRALGLLVEAVADIYTSNGEDHQPVPATGQGDGEGCIESLLISGDDMIQILETSAFSTMAAIDDPVAA